MQDFNVLDRYWICSLGHINNTSVASGPGQATSVIKRCGHCGSAASRGLRQVGQATKTAQPSYPLWYAYLETNVVGY